LSQRLKLLLTPPAWRLLAATVRRTPRAGTARDGAVIFACLHRDMIPAILHTRPARPALLVSRSSDGEILRRTLSREGFSFVRGSTGKEGSAAFLGLLAVLQAGGSVGLAVDGPRGPFGVVHDGVIRLARLAGVPIVPLRCRPGAHVALKTWDRTVVPAPLGRLVVTEAPDLSVDREAGAEDCAAAARLLAAALVGGEAGT
jgi:hypothetical protein